MPGPDVLVVAPMMPFVLDALQDQFTLHRLWEADDRKAFIAKVAPRIRAVTNPPDGRVDSDLIRQLPALEIIANFGVGYDIVDVAAAVDVGVVVTHTPDVLTEEVADTTLGLLLMTIRELSAAERYLRAGKWRDAPFPLTAATLRDRRVGIAGLGRIGKAIARRLEAFDVAIAYFGRRQQSMVGYPYYDDLETMAREVDTLIATLPGGSETDRIFGRAVFDALGPEGIFINIGRGSSVDEPALIEALKTGRLRAAGLDVFANEPNVSEALLALDNAVLLPHVASASQHTRERMGRLVVDNLISWFGTGRPLTPVPETPFISGI